MVRGKEIAVYKGDSLLAVGTIKECAHAMGVKYRTILHYQTPAYKKQIQERKKAKNYTYVIELEDDN